MARPLYTSAIVLLCLVGSFLLLWPYEDDRSLSWLRSHLEIVDGQLQGLSDLLQDYRNTHGHYPTNNEGLAALDNFETHFTVRCYRWLDAAQGYESSGFYGDGRNRFWWQSSKRELQEFRRNHGRPPRDQDEFCMTRLGMNFSEREPNGETEEQPTEVEMAIDRNNNIFLLDRAGVLSPWLLPYNYENRNGCNADAFSQSLADGDRWGYSARIDDGVYISSSGGYLYAQRYRRMWWHRNGPRLFGVLLIFTGIAVAVCSAVRARRGRPLLGILAVIPGVLVGGSLLGYVTCYIMAELFSRRSPEMVSLQMELLEKYRENGVIDEETYLRAASAVRRDTPKLDDEAEERRE